MKIIQTAVKKVNSVATNAVMAFVLAKAGISMGYAKIKEKAKAANVTLKEYVGNEDNIGHISLVFYDVLPLGMKLGLRYEKFHEEFASRFKTIRNWIYKYDDEQTSDSVEAKNDEPVTKQEEASPVNADSADAPAKKVAAKRVAKPKVEATVEGDGAAAPAKKVATKRVAKPKVESTVKGDGAAAPAKKVATKRVAKPKVESTVEGDGAAAPAKKVATKRVAKPKVTKEPSVE